MWTAKAKDRLTGTRAEDAARRLMRAVKPAPLSVPLAKAQLYDAQTAEVARRVLGSGGNAIDVGANRGEILREIISASPRGEHVAVEPLPRYAKGLRRKFPTVTVYEAALSDQPGTARFRRVIGAAEESSLDGLGHQVDGAPTEYFDVNVMTLDQVAPDPVHFVKIDAEHAEYQILLGADRVLAQRPVIAFELGANQTKVWDLLTSRGYELHRLFEWLHGDVPPARSIDELRHGVVGEYFFLAVPSSPSRP